MKIGIFLLALCIPLIAFSQPTEPGSEIIALNQKIDDAVIAKDTLFLRDYYAGDFVFTHGTGLVDNKTSWLTSVVNPASVFLSRQHDSTVVEMHGDVGILSGRLLVTRRDKTQISKYGLRYIRVFRREDGNWRMISHRTTSEWHY